MGGGLPAFFQQVFTLLSGVVGISIVGIILVIGVLEAARHRRMEPFIAALIGGAAFYAIPWIMSTVMQGGPG